MAREASHRIMVNDSPRVLRLTGFDQYRHPMNKKLLVGRTDPAKVIATQFHYLLAKSGPANVAKTHLGINLGICTTEELAARPEWNDHNDVFRSCKVKPQTLRNQPDYVGSDIVLLVPDMSPVITHTDMARLMDFVGTFFYVLDHFPTATEASVRDSNMWKMWLGLFVAGYAPSGQVLLAEMVDHLKAVDHQMVKWYPRR